MRRGLAAVLCTLTICQVGGPTEENALPPPAEPIAEEPEGEAAAEADDAVSYDHGYPCLSFAERHSGMMYII